MVKVNTINIFHVFVSRIGSGSMCKKNDYEYIKWSKQRSKNITFFMRVVDENI